MELGSEFHIDLTDKSIKTNTIYPILQKYNTFYTAYGRTAITLLYEYLQKKVGGQNRRVLLPAYICSSVIRSFPKECVFFYDLGDDFTIEERILVKMLESGEFDGGFFYLVHYFGWLQQDVTLQHIQELCKSHHITIIEDTTHSIFTKERTIGDYCIASLRKWMPVPEGGVIYSMYDLPQTWRKLEHIRSSGKINAMVLKQVFLGQMRDYKELAGLTVFNEAYRHIFMQEEERIDREKYYAISDLSAFLLQCEDVSEIERARRKNYQYLGELLYREGISLYGWKQYQKNDNSELTVPYTALLRLRDRNQLRNYLMDHKIYCAVHWPIEMQEQYTHIHVSEWSKQLISLPIDQRYRDAEMEFLAEMVIKYFQKKY